MDTMLGFAGVVIATLVALFVALALNWVLLHAAFLLMQPATATRRTARPSLVQGTRLLALAYSRRR